MNIEQSLERIAMALERLTVMTGNPVPPEAKPVKEKKQKLAVENVDVDPLADVEAAPVIVQEKKISTDEIHKALKTFMDKNGIDKTKALMIKHGAAPAKPILTSIPEKNYTALLKEIGA